MSYIPSTDFLALLRQTGSGLRPERMPGLDYVVAAMARAGLFALAVQQTAPIINQTTTVWFKPASPQSWVSEGTTYLWNAVDGQYEVATPLAWSNLIIASALAAGGTALFDLLAPTTTEGDMIVREGGHNVRLPIGPNGYALISNGVDPLWTAFLQAATGAAPRTWQSKAGDILCVLDFPGVDPTGATDSTAGMQLAHNTGKLIYYPHGTYLFTSGLTIASGGIVGDGPTQTILTSNDATAVNLIEYTGQWFSNARSNAPTFHNFSLIGNPAKPNGAGLQVLPAAGEASYLDFHNVHFAYLPMGIDFVAASLWSITACKFLAYTVAGVQVANTNSGDSGDSVIMGCVFNTPFTTGSGVWQKSSGGLKILGNKFLGGQRAYTMNLQNGPTGVLVISGNSMEQFSGAGISLAQAVGGSTFVNAIITGNEIASNNVAGIGTDASGFLSELTITGNVFNIGGTNPTPCMFLNSVTDFLIGDNMFKGNNIGGSSAINLASCVNGKIAKNTYANLTSPLAITASPTVSIDLDTQSGSIVSTTTNIAYGALFRSADITVNFPRPFLAAPSISDFIAVGSSGAGECGIVVVSVTATQAVFRTISGVTSVTPTMNWKCAGVL